MSDDFKASYSIKLLNTQGASFINDFKGYDYCGEVNKIRWCITISSNSPSEFQWVCTSCGHHGIFLADKNKIFTKLEMLAKIGDRELAKALRLISRVDRVLSNIK